jgi:hypothetical protein
VPQDFWTGDPPEQKFHWDSTEDRVAWVKQRDFDACLYLPWPWEDHLNPAIRQTVWREEDPAEPYPILCSEWASPQGRLCAKIRKTADYPLDTVLMFNDFNTPRYTKPLFATGEDMLTFVRRDPYGVEAGDLAEWHPKGSAGYMDAPFHVADAAFGMVVAYDMLYHCFSASERQEVERAFAEHGVYLLYRPLVSRRDFYVRMNQGCCSACR